MPVHPFGDPPVYQSYFRPDPGSDGSLYKSPPDGDFPDDKGTDRGGQRPAEGKGAKGKKAPGGKICRKQLQI